MVANRALLSPPLRARSPVPAPRAKTSPSRGLASVYCWGFLIIIIIKTDEMVEGTGSGREANAEAGVQVPLLGVRLYLCLNRRFQYWNTRRTKIYGGLGGFGVFLHLQARRRVCPVPTETPGIRAGNRLPRPRGPQQPHESHEAAEGQGETALLLRSGRGAPRRSRRCGATTPPRFPLSAPRRRFPAGRALSVLAKPAPERLRGAPRSSPRAGAGAEGTRWRWVPAAAAAPAASPSPALPRICSIRQLGMLGREGGVDPLIKVMRN